MNRRFAFVLIGGALGAAAGFLLACAFIIFGAGVFWLFIFGDDTWPSAAETALTMAAALIWFVAVVAGAIIGWRSTPEPVR
ncbi:MAG: hypothetical protein ABI782_07260 [Anaerolineaceae bacterium]